jgi:pimeloyl-ACP methyl ester carboxylesterase
MAWRLTPWLARAGLAAVARLRRRPLAADEFVNLQIWGSANDDHGPLWRSFLTEQRALMREVDDLAASLPEVTQPVLLMADAHDMIIPVRATRRLAAALPDARVELLNGPGHHLPRRAAPQIAGAIAAFLATLDDQAAA